MSCDSGNNSCSKESLAFKKLDNEKYIPSVVDGLTQNQRKVVFMSFKLCREEEVSVPTLSSAVASRAAFNEPESVRSLTIVKLAQDFVGSNNINILLPIGQFGTRLDAGKDAAPAGQLYTQLNSIVQSVFSVLDEPLLTQLFDDNVEIEPEYYLPVIPMVLVNGVNVKTDSFLSEIPKYNPKDLVENIYRLMENKELKSMIPWYKGFRGTVDKISDHSYLVKGVVKVLPGNMIEVLELPIGESTYEYKKKVVEKFLYAGEILKYEKYYSCDSARFKIHLTLVRFKLMELEGFHKVFGLQKSLDTSSMMLLDGNGELKHYQTTDDIIRDFYDVRLRMYERRKEYHTALISAEIEKLDNQYRFVSEMKEGLININNQKSAIVNKMLSERNYVSDPVKYVNLKAKNKNYDVWESDDEEDVKSKLPDFEYLLDMPISYTFDQGSEKLLAEKSKKMEELEVLKLKQPKELWKDDLKIFLDQFEASLV